MSDLRNLLQFLNPSDARRALENPSKALRVVKNSLNATPNKEQLDSQRAASERRRELARLFNCEESKIDSYYSEIMRSPIPNRLAEVENEFANKSYSPGGMDFNGETAYIISRLLDPSTVLEVGVANGMSTFYLLTALDQTSVDNSVVYGIDRPQFENQIRERRGKIALKNAGGYIPDEKEVGWIAPKSLRMRHNYQIQIGDFTKILEPVLEEIDGLDFGIYDASKDPSEMRYAYNKIIDSLVPGGVLLSDDILHTDVFQEVSATREGKYATFYNCGIFRKQN
ncbi:Predicted O-methyltransferase YrrM [Halogranum gelatinilyticum]|uniref:Predicted O-methyltransferase YrrM n=1 Tax=Halogranum gelatinilyticum TaxID=660521 RepID=A0A1G9X5D3_9EURY|nr:class I SAM-dependent methyltransferase [Halogranum gelatinilyticum]SDM91954.1 Predicted O-methyltransferase YrrM [Halogranum gelatinilyticum]